VTLLTTMELAKHTGYSVQYIAQLVQRGQLVPAGRKGNGRLFNPDSLAPKSKARGNELRVMPKHCGEHCRTCAYWARRGAEGACYQHNEWVSGEYPACAAWVADAWRGRRGKPA
jgi:hypothetical protein